MAAVDTPPPPAGAPPPAADAFGAVVDGDDEQDAESADSLDDVIADLKSRADQRQEDLSEIQRTVANKNPEKRTIYVGQVDQSTLPEELYFDVFRDCGAIERVNIMTDHHMMPAGYAYIQFKDVRAAEKALKKHGLNWRGLRLEICMKQSTIQDQPKFTRMDAGGALRGGPMTGFAGIPMSSSGGGGGGGRRGRRGGGGGGGGGGMMPPPPPGGFGGAPLGGGGGGRRRGGRGGSDRFAPY